MKGKKYIFSGLVQGVSFRYNTYLISKKYSVKGYVRNLPNRTVELFASGLKDEIESFIHDIKIKFSENIDEIKVEDYVIEQEFDNFLIIT
jgi:acylphosphatase